jgi:hypothetical protein
VASLAPTAIMHVSWVEFTSRRGERQGGSVATQLPSSQIQMLWPVHKSACVNRPQKLLGNGQIGRQLLACSVQAIGARTGPCAGVQLRVYIPPKLA